MQECTALATIWPADGETGPERYELSENFRPVWRPASPGPAMRLVAPLECPLAALAALHLACAGRLEQVTGLRPPADPNRPPDLSADKAHELYRALTGRAVSVVRFPRCLVSDRELTCLRSSGVRVDLLDSDWTLAGGWR
jgi:hypothetical protein